MSLCSVNDELSSTQLLERGKEAICKLHLAIRDTETAFGLSDRWKRPTLRRRECHLPPK